MEMLQLRYFYESAKNETFTKTAEKYMVPATSVSASVKRLEKEVGCELFTRTHNRIILNDNGKRLMQSLSVVFDELDGAIDALGTLSTDTRKIKMLVRAMRGEITNHIIEYRTRHPHISFMTVFDFNENNFDNYDIIIDEECDNYPGYEKFDLYTTKIRLRVSPDNPLCKRKLTLKQLADQPFVSTGENNSMHKILIDACKKAGFSPNIVVQSNDILCIRKCVESNVGIGLAREYPCLSNPDSFQYLDVSDFDIKQTICAYYRKQSDYGNVEHFLKFLKKKIL